MKGVEENSFVLSETNPNPKVLESHDLWIPFDFEQTNSSVQCMYPLVNGKHRKSFYLIRNLWV